MLRGKFWQDWGWRQAWEGIFIALRKRLSRDGAPQKRISEASDLIVASLRRVGVFPAPIKLIRQKHNR